MTRCSEFFVVSLFFAFTMKAVGELVHEVMGHGIFVLLFGGEIIHLHISILWPYELSYIEWTGNFMPWQQTWIAGGGILISLIVSGLIQALLLLNSVKDWRLSTLLRWLAFWTFLNPTVYLIIGGIKPFGDVAYLITDGVLIQSTSLLLGFLLFFVCFFLLSQILINQLLEINVVKTIKEFRIALIIFWTTIPLITAAYCLGLGVSLLYLQIFMVLSFAPPLMAVLIPNILKTHLRLNKKGCR
jgi:hypothetical protein